MTDQLLTTIRNKLTDLSLLALAILAFPLTIGTFIRSSASGLRPIDVALPILLFLILLVYIRRHTIHHRIKTLALIGFLTLSALFTFFSYGLLSMGVSILLLIITLSTLLTSKKISIAIIILCFTIFIAYMVLFTTGVIEIPEKATDYMLKWSGWLTQLLGFSAMALVLYFAVSYTIRRLSDTLFQNHKLHITKEEELQKLVEKRTNDLEASIQELMRKEKLASMGALVAGVAHEINTPLGVAVTASSYLTEQTLTLQKKMDGQQLKKSDLDHYLTAALETTTILNDTLARAARLVNSFKKVSVSHTADYTTLFNLTEYIQSVLLTLKHEYKNSGHQIVFDEEQAFWLSSDPSLFSQIFTNLIMNALIHGLADETKGTIQINLTSLEEGFSIDISDDGKGIEAEALTHIFDPFYTTNRGGGGSGLGLSIVHNIVTERLKGTIHCKSTPGSGTAFHIELPIKTSDHHKEVKPS